MSDSFQHYFGLIGFPLTHSFSKGFFTEKFEREGNKDQYIYENFPLSQIGELPALLEKHPHLRGLNVTIPYKESVIPYLDSLDSTAAAVGAVNTIKIDAQKKRIGYNTDVIGFEKSLLPLIQNKKIKKALILGTGGAAKAVQYVLKKNHIVFDNVSRQKGENSLSYHDIKNLDAYTLIINTTPLGMFPNIKDMPPLPYQSLSEEHILYDLVYNPPITAFIHEGIKKSCTVSNGLDMLHAQALAAWDIWQTSL